MTQKVVEIKFMMLTENMLVEHIGIRMVIGNILEMLRLMLNGRHILLHLNTTQITEKLHHL
jgi:hypothetical protein